MTAAFDGDAFLEGRAAQQRARVAGALWLVVIVTGIFSEMFVRANLLVRNDGAATSANILQHQALFRLGVVSDITATACYLAVVAILFDLLRPAGRALSGVAAAFGVAGSAISGLNMLASFAPLIILSNAEHLVGFTSQQLQSVVLLQVKLYGYGADISLIFFSGVYLILVGLLVVRSRFLPAAVGLLLMVAGVCYLAGSVSTFLNPDFSRAMGVFIYLPGGIAELAMTLWLIIRGVNPHLWTSATSATAEG
jgi:Domain of unknown function (DUF4386)